MGGSCLSYCSRPQLLLKQNKCNAKVLTVCVCFCHAYVFNWSNFQIEQLYSFGVNFKMFQSSGVMVWHLMVLSFAAWHGGSLSTSEGPEHHVSLRQRSLIAATWKNSLVNTQTTVFKYLDLYRLCNFCCFSAECRSLFFFFVSVEGSCSFLLFLINSLLQVDSEVALFIIFNKQSDCVLIAKELLIKAFFPLIVVLIP